MVELGQWRHREEWQLPSRVVVLQRGAGRRSADYFAATEAAGIPIEVQSLYDEARTVDPAVRSAEILVSSAVPITAEDVQQLDRCRFILRPYVGYDDIDVDALTARGILLANIPDAFSEEVAVHTLALILAFNRFLFRADRYVREGGYWTQRGRADLPIHHPKALTLGIIGFGTIGQLLAERAKPLGFRMLAYDPFPAREAAQRLGVAFSSLEEVLGQSDYLSLHVFLNTQTTHLMDE
ncbi:MAG: hypothetical protein M1298_01955, partial [Chloroflexi bacterium]|nr:hypothetical protein [Chloroflexota bacterium]